MAVYYRWVILVLSSPYYSPYSSPLLYYSIGYWSSKQRSNNRRQMCDKIKVLSERRYLKEEPSKEIVLIILEYIILLSDVS